MNSRYLPNQWLNSLNSLGYMHNETVNIYTHLIGAITALTGSVFMFQLLEPRYDTSSQEDVLVFASYFFGAASCLGISATFHTISNHSPAVAKWGNQLDYLGIVFLIWGSFVPSIYYGFGGNVALVRRYWTMVRSSISSLLGSGALIKISRSRQSALALPSYPSRQSSGLRNGDHSVLQCSWLWVFPLSYQ